MKVALTPSITRLEVLPLARDKVSGSNNDWTVMILHRLTPSVPLVL